MPEVMKSSTEFGSGQPNLEPVRGLPMRKRWSGRKVARTPDREVHADCRCRDPYGETPADQEEVVLDVRDLPMQGGIGRTLQRMEVLPGGQTLRHVNSLVPWPLFAMLETRGYRYRLIGREPGNVNILIWPLTGSAREAQ